jgi:hypothetical protein
VCSDNSTSTDESDNSSGKDSSISVAKKHSLTKNDDSILIGDKPQKRQIGRRRYFSADGSFGRPILLEDKYDKTIYFLLQFFLLTTSSAVAVILLSSLLNYYHDVAHSLFPLLLLGLRIRSLWSPLLLLAPLLPIHWLNDQATNHISDYEKATKQTLMVTPHFSFTFFY